MRRVVSLFLPTWPTDRLRQHAGAPPADQPLITSAHDGRRLTVASVDRAAAALGLAAGMELAHARAMVPGLTAMPADAAGDAAALGRLAACCLRYAPLTAPNPPDGVWIDLTGAAHLHGGEHATMVDLLAWLAARGTAARAAVADTPGAAHALARHAGEAITIAPPGVGLAVLADLPITALRLAPDIVAGLRRLGFEQVGSLARTPRAPLARRFGLSVLERLDQALGHLREPIEPVFPPEIVSQRLAFVEPIGTAEAFAVVITELTEAVCDRLEASGQGARLLDLLFERVDGSVQVVGIGTARPSRAAPHLARLLRERLEAVDPGPGVEAMRLVVSLAEPLGYRQPAPGLADADSEGAEDIAALVDRLENRLGAGRVYRAAPVESDVPERSVRRVPPLGAPPRSNWPPALPRPVRLLDPPQPVEAMALLPDQPPAAFTWRRRRHRVRRADGPERIHGEWWRRPTEVDAVRDYFAVEDEDGRRFWLFRHGDGVDPATGDLRWFLHGLF